MPSKCSILFVFSEVYNINKNKTIKWSKEINMEVMGTYLLVNECRGNPLPKKMRTSPNKILLIEKILLLGRST